MNNNSYKLSLKVINAETSSGVPDVELDITGESLRKRATSDKNGECAINLNEYGKYTVKVLSTPNNLFSLSCDNEVNYDETGLQLAGEPISKLRFLLLPRLNTNSRFI